MLNLKYLFLLKVKNVIIERVANAKKWLDEIIKSSVIWGCALQSLFKK